MWPYEGVVDGVSAFFVGRVVVRCSDDTDEQAKIVEGLSGLVHLRVSSVVLALGEKTEGHREMDGTNLDVCTVVGGGSRNGEIDLSPDCKLTKKNKGLRECNCVIWRWTWFRKWRWSLFEEVIDHVDHVDDHAGDTG